MASQAWIPELFDNALAGVSSAVSPELLPQNQVAWGINIANRGSKPSTRPSIRRLMTLPSGLVQGASYFSVQGGMGVISVSGRIYRLRINPRDASYEPLDIDPNSGVIKQVYMQQTVETLVIQDGQSDAILYNGSVVRRADPSQKEVPRGKQMAYGNGRLWVATGGKNLVAGDIRSSISGSELFFTETDYLSGGGVFYFPRGITGLGFIATTGTSDYGALMVFGPDYADSLRADITFRDLWASTPGFITNVLRHTGCASHWSLASINQDLYWRDSSGGIRSIRSSLADESGAGNAPISREVSRLTDYDSPQLLDFCSAISFDNRLLMTSSPRLNSQGGITWQDLISLDFAPVSTMQGKTMPAYDGQWHGLNFTHLFQGQFSGRSRAFAITHDTEGSNSLWEINLDGHGGTDDTTVVCSSGTGLAEEAPIVSVVEYGRRSFGNPSRRKRLERCDVYLADIQGELNLKVYWRADNNQKWLLWDEGLDVCAKDGDPETVGATTHVWRNLLPQQRPQLKTYTIPSVIDGITHYSLQNGFEFQIRLVWTGKAKIYKTILYASMLPDTNYSLREIVESQCQFNDVSGNQVGMDVALVSACPFLEITDPDDQTVSLTDTIQYEQAEGPFIYPELAFGGGFYRTATVSGENRGKYSYYGDTPWNTDCCVNDCSPGYYAGKGATQHIFSGSSTLSVDGTYYVGLLMDDVYSRGAGPSSAFIYPSEPHIANYAQTVVDMKRGWEVKSIPFLAQHNEIFSDYAARQVVERYYTDANFSGVQGFFGGGSGGAIWCLGYEAEFIYTDIIELQGLGIPVTIFGTPAKTQHLITTGPNAYTGSISRVKVPINLPLTKDKFYVEYTYLVTPDDGSAPYTMTLNIEYPSSIHGRFFITEEFPKVVDAVVTVQDVRVLYYKVVTDTFDAETQSIETKAASSIASWPNKGVFSVSLPNCEVWDNFEEGIEGVCYIVSGGLGWASSGTFMTSDPLMASDDFESYTEGEQYSFYAGVGWSAFGRSKIVDIVTAFDEFETLLKMGNLTLPVNSAKFADAATDVIAAPANAAYNLTDFTIQMWVNPSGFLHQEGLIGNISSAGGMDTSNGFEAYIVSGPNVRSYVKTRLRVGGVTSEITGGINFFGSSARHWVGITFVRSGSIVSAYVNYGKTYLLDSAGDSGLVGAITASANLLIGNRDTTTSPLTGKVSEVRIWNYARTITEINSDAIIRLSGSETGLVGYFPMDEASGSTVFDRSPTANNATRGATGAIDLQDLQYLPVYIYLDGNFWDMISTTDGLPYSGKFITLT